MARIDLHTGDHANIHVKNIGGSLQVKGWDEDNVRIDVRSQEDLHYESDGNELELSCDSDCILRVPIESELHIESVSGDAYISYIESAIQIDTVGGSLTLKNIGSVKLGEVAGNLTARTIEGEISAEQVSGNASLRDVDGDVEISEVAANLSVRGVEGNIEAKSNGNADLRLDVETGMDYHVEADGNLFCYLGDETDADVSLESGANNIQIFTSGGKQSFQTQRHEFKLGDGGSEIELKAGGHIDFRSSDSKSDSGVDFDLDLDFVDDMSDLADSISEQVSSQVEGQLEGLNAQLEALQERLRESGGRAALQAQRKVQAAQRRIQHKLEHKLRGPHGRIINVGTSFKKAEPVSDNERKMILQMLGDKKISVQEAEMLLNSLEGRSAAAPVPPTPPVPSVPPVPPVPATPVAREGDKND